jgi:hypothetical protein
MVVLVANTMCRTELTTLWLRGNHFSSAFCKIIGGSSSSSYALTDIDLSGNHLGDKGLQNLCLFLDKCTNLQSLCVFSVGFIASCVDCALFSLFKHVVSSLFKRNSPSLRCLSRCKLHELSPLQSVVLVPRLQEHFALCLFSLFSLLFFPADCCRCWRRRCSHTWTCPGTSCLRAQTAPSLPCCSRTAASRR